MGTDVSRCVFACAIATCFACSASAPPGDVADMALVGKHVLEVTEGEDSCFLRHSGGGSSPVRLALKPPCYFLRDETGEPQAMNYEDSDAAATLVVVGNPVSEATRVEWGLGENELCGEKAQAVLVADESVLITDKTLEGKVMCRNHGTDEKDFWYFAH